MGSSLLFFQKGERFGPFSSNLRETAARVAGNSLPEAQPRRSELATSLAACCNHLAAVCIPTLSLPDSPPRPVVDAGRLRSLSVPCPMPAATLQESPAISPRRPGSTSHGLLSVGLGPAIPQFSQPQVLKIKSIKDQRCLPSRERQELLRLSFCASAQRPHTTPSCGLLPSQRFARLSNPAEENLQDLKKK